jgi:NOL1/NOP2/sun family putative RNA methylase
VTQLPEAFLKKMQNILGDEYNTYLESFEKPAFRGLRVNTLRCLSWEFKAISPCKLEQTPFSFNGFYIDNILTGRHPFHHAGVFYLQEPSAMSAVTAAGISKGMRVLDLCAAPGGKTTQAAAELKGEGLLICNEIVPSRARILLSNIERCGVTNAAITNEKPEVICEQLRGFFDVVLVDAPCSGEGMFRREPKAAAQWNDLTNTACAKRQLVILNTAKIALKENGVLVYSTCTFSPEENEGVVDAFLKQNVDFEIEDISAKFGRCAEPLWANASTELKKARRIFPQDGGEGHFVARLRKHAFEPCKVLNWNNSINISDSNIFEDFFNSQFEGNINGELHEASGNVYILPQGLPEFRGINMLRAGVFAGRIKQGRFEPEHALYMAAQAAKPRNVCLLLLEGSELSAWLHGEAIEAPSILEKGYASVQVQGFPVGFGKVADGILKNHYPKGLRNL